MSESTTSAQNDKSSALKRVFSPLSLTRVLQGSTRLISYFVAAATVYIIADGNIDTITAISPILGRLIEKIGGDVLAGMLERISNGEENILSPEQIRALIEDELSNLPMDEMLTEKEFYRATSRLIRQEEEHFQVLSQGLGTLLNLLRQLQPSDIPPLSVIPRSARPLLTSCFLLVVISFSMCFIFPH